MTHPIDLRALSKGHPGLSPVKGESLAEAAAVCLESQLHFDRSTTLKLTGDRELDCDLGWQPANQQQRDTYADAAEATEEGACAVAICVLESIFRVVVTQRSRKRSAFDYFLAHTSDLLFQNAIRLEVSGILNGEQSAIETRVEEKLQRLDRYRSRMPAIVAVVEFGTPQARIQSK